MATVKYFPRTTQSVHFENMVNWDVYQTGIPNLTYDDPGVFSLNENNPSIILRGGEQQSEPYGWKFGENSRIVMSIFTGNLTGSAIISEAKLSVKLKDVYKSGSWGITPSFRLVKFTPPASIGSGGNYGFSASDVYKSDIDKSVIISETIIDNSSLIDGARVEFNLDLSKLDIEYGDSFSYEGHTNIAIVTDYDLSGGIPWSKHQYQKYELYTQTAPVVDRPFMEITFTESRSHYFEWFNKEEFAVSDPGMGASSGDEHWDNVSTLINGSETIVGSDFTEKSDTGHTVTIEAGVTQTTGSGGKFGEGYTFGSYASNHYMTIPDHDDFNLAGGNFTIEFWIKLTTASQHQYGNIFSHGNAGGQEHVLQIGDWDNPGDWNLDWFARGGLSSWMNVFETSGDNQTGPLTVGNWHHVALVRNGDVFSIYLDGNFRQSDTKTGSIQNYTNDFHIGRRPVGPRGSIEGIIDDFRITKGIARYTGTVQTDWGNFSEIDTEWATQSGSSGGGDGLVEGQKGDALWDNVTGYYRFNGDYEDRSENSGDIEVIGTKEIETTEQWAGTGALKLNNAYTYRNAIKLEGDTINFGSGDFCIEFMFKIDANFTLTNNTDYYLMDFREVYPSPTTLQYLRFVNDGTSIKLLDQTASSEIENSSDDDYTFEVDTWYHIAVSKDSSNIRVFIDGDCNNANFSAGNYGGQEIWINSRVDNIGSTYNTDGQGLNIYIDELRITTGNKRYAHGSNFTSLTQEHYDYEIPTSVGDDHWSETSLLLKFDETSIYDYSAGTLDLFTNQPTDSSKNQKTVSLQGDPYNVFTGVFAGLGSLYLNSTSYLILPDHSEYDFGTNDFTIEFSVKYTISDHVQWIFSFDGELGEDDWRLGISSGGQIVFGQVGSGIITGAYVLFANSNMTLDDDKWHKVSFCREATSGSFCDMTCRVSSEDGSSQYSQTISGEDLIGFNNITTQKYIGYHPAYPDKKFIGYLDEIRITNGTARYSDSVVDPYLAYDDPIELFPTIAQYWDYEEPAIGAEIEDTSLEISHFEYILLPFVEERPQFIDGNMQLIAMTQRGELLDGIDTRLNRKDLGDPAITIDDYNDVLFAFNDGKMQFMRYWDESEDDTSINATDDLVTQEAIDDGGGELDTSVVTFGQIITEQIIFFEELLPFADLPLLIPTHKDDNVTPALANIDGWTPEQFSFSNDFNITPDYRWDKTDIGTYKTFIGGYIKNVGEGTISSDLTIGVQSLGYLSGVSSLDTDLVSYYKMDNNWQDIKSSNHGIAYNEASFDSSEKKLGTHAGAFDGVNDYSGVETDDFAYTTDFSVSFWVKPNDKTQWGRMVDYSHYGAGGSHGWFFGWYDQTSTVEFRLEQVASVQSLTTPNLTHDGTTWYHIVGTYDKTSEIAKLYVDGIEVDSISTSGTQTYTNISSLGFGARINPSPTEYLNGNLDGIGIWEKTLTPSEVGTLYNTGDGIEYYGKHSYEEDILEEIATIDLFNYPISYNFIDGVYVGDPTSVKSLESVHANFVISSNEWHSLEFNEIVANSFADSILDIDPLSDTYGEATPPIDSSGIKTFDDWERRSFQFINEAPGAYGVIDDFGMKLNEDNYYHLPNYSSDNHYGYHIDKVLSHGTINVVDTTDGAKNIYDIEILEEIATIDKDENIINSLKETIVNWFNYVGFAPHVDVTKDIDPNSYIMFTEIIDSGSVEDHIPMFKDDGTTLARTSSDQFRDKSFSETFDDIVITDGIDSYIHYETQKNYLDVDVPKWNYNDLIEGTVLDPRIERNLIDGIQFIGEEIFDIKSEFTITPTYQVSSVMGNFWHQSYRFNNGQDTVLDMRYSNDYTETFNLSAKSFYVTGGNQEDGDVFPIYRDQDTTTDLLATLTVEPDPNLMLTDEHSAHVELLITGTNSTTNLEGSTVSVSGTAVDFYDAGGEISGWELEENFVATLADNTELACSNIDTSGDEVTVDWWGYRDSGDATPNFDEWWNGGTSSFRNTTNQTGTLGSTGKWSFYGGESGSETTWINFQDIDDTGWHHWAFVRNGTDLYFFLDGELIAGEVASWDDDIDFTTIGKGLKGKIKNFRVTKKARWTSNFDGLLDTLKGEWTKDGSEYKLQVSPKLGVSVESESTHTNPIGINDYKVSTGTGGRILSGYLQSDVDMSSYWGEDFASTPTVRNVAGKDVDIRWAWSNGAIPVWDENADGSRGEVHPSVFAIENIETDLKEFYSDSDHFYQYIQAFGNTLEGFGFPSGVGSGEEHWDNVEFILQSNTTDGETSFTGEGKGDQSDSPHTITRGDDTYHESDGAKSGMWDTSIKFDGSSDKLVVTDNLSDFTFESNPYTIEFWFYRDAFSGNDSYSYLFDMRPGGTNGYYPSAFIDSSNVVTYYVDNSSVIQSSALSLDTWYHFAIVRDSSDDTTMYINGKKHGNVWNHSTDFATVSSFRIGNYSGSDSYPLDGYMNDFRITKGIARYNGSSTSAEWSNFDEIEEAFEIGSGGQPANNMATVPYTDRINPYDSSNTIILREEQETAYDIELPDNLTDFVGYVTYPAIPGLDDLTPDSFQFTGGNMVVVDTKIKKYAYEPSIYPNVASDYKEVENTHQLVANGFGVALDSGQYLDTTISNAGEYDYNAIKHTYVNEGSIESPDMVRKVSISGATAVDLGVTPEITSGVQTGISITDGSYFDTNSHRDSQTVKDPYTVIVEEEIHHDTFEHSIPTTKVVGAVESQAISRLDSFSQDQFAFSNQGMNIAIDSSFDTEYPTTGTVTEGNLSNPPSNSMVKTIFEGRVSLDEKLVNQYDVGGKKIIKLQAIFDEMWTMEGQEVVSDIWEQWDSWKTSQWLDSTIMEVANFGGDFFQLVNQGFNPVADTIKLADFTSGTSENTFLNLVSQVVDDVPFSYNSGTNLLTLSLNPAKVMVSENYTMNEYVWVGKLQESEENVNVLDISTYKFWQVKFIDSGANSVSLYIPPGDESIIEPTVGVDPSGNLSILLSSTSMVDLMYYHRRV